MTQYRPLWYSWGNS